MSSNRLTKGNIEKMANLDSDVEVIEEEENENNGAVHEVDVGNEVFNASETASVMSRKRRYSFSSLTNFYSTFSSSPDSPPPSPPSPDSPRPSPDSPPPSPDSPPPSPDSGPPSPDSGPPSPDSPQLEYSSLSGSSMSCETIKSKRPAYAAHLARIRYDNVNHWVQWGAKAKCMMCHTGYPKSKCTKCHVHLCCNSQKNCFVSYHT